MAVREDDKDEKVAEEAVKEEPAAVVPMKRGRPKKENVDKPAPKPRGRPKKAK